MAFGARQGLDGNNGGACRTRRLCHLRYRKHPLAGKLQMVTF